MILSLLSPVKIRFFILFALLAGISACVKGPSYPLEPHIEFKSVSSASLFSGYVDTITVSFTDGDGDIGVYASSSDSCDPCSFKRGDTSCLFMHSYNVFMIDSRDTCVSYFASANISSDSKFKGISGDIDIIRAIDSKKCLSVPDPNCPLDTVVYTIVIRDLANHFSNKVKTTPIVVDGR